MVIERNKPKELVPVAVKEKDNRPLIIGIIALVAVLVLAGLLLFSDRFVGQAIQYQDTTSIPLPSAGIFLDDNTVFVGEGFDITIKARLEEYSNTVAVKFKLILDNLSLGNSCADSVISNLGWDDFVNITCENGMVIFESATFDSNEAKSGLFDVATINFNEEQIGSYNLNFEQFDIFEMSFDPNNMIGAGESATIVVSERDLCESVTCSEGETCSGGVCVMSTEEALTCSMIGEACTERGYDASGVILYCVNDIYEEVSGETGICVDSECIPASEQINVASGEGRGCSLSSQCEQNEKCYNGGCVASSLVDDLHEFCLFDECTINSDCTDPPAPYCVGDQLFTPDYPSRNYGECTAGVCEYPDVDTIDCLNGCVNGACVPSEDCSDGIDNDGDDLVDCDDSECVTNPACVTTLLGDVDGNGCVSTNELFSFIESWYTNEIEISELFPVIDSWYAEGC